MFFEWWCRLGKTTSDGKMTWLVNRNEKRSEKTKENDCFYSMNEFFWAKFQKYIFLLLGWFFRTFFEKKKAFSWMNNFLEQTVFLNKQFYWTNDYTYWTIVKWETNYDENEWYFWERPKSIVMNYYIKKETKSAIHERWSIFVKSMI